MMGTIRCCYQCPDRHYNCHSTCEKYKAEKQALKREYNDSEWQVERYYRAKWKKVYHQRTMKTKR